MRGIELMLAVDTRIDDRDLAWCDPIDGNDLLEGLAGTRKGMHQVSIASRRVANVAGLVRLLGVELDHDRRGFRNNGYIRQQVEGQPGIHDVHDLHMAAFYEAQDEFGKG